MKIGDRVFVHGYVDEIRKDTIIIRNNGGYFGTIPSEIIKGDLVRCKDCKYQDKGENESESWNLCMFRPWLYIPTSDDHFCGYGERGEQDDNRTGD